MRFRGSFFMGIEDIRGPTPQPTPSLFFGTFTSSPYLFKKKPPRSFKDPSFYCISDCQVQWPRRGKGKKRVKASAERVFFQHTNAKSSRTSLRSALGHPSILGNHPLSITSESTLESESSDSSSGNSMLRKDKL